MKEIEMDNFPADPNSLGTVWKDLVQNPAQALRHWNYKSAIFSSTMRASIFLLTYLQFARKDDATSQVLALALGAAAAQFIYRFISAGFIGYFIQSFSRVNPPWKAFLLIMLVVPGVSHVLEFLVQYFYGYFTHTSHNTDEAIVRSICVSIISSIFNLFAMRRGVLLVGLEESKSFWGDVKHIPLVVVQFCAFIPMEICKMIARSQFLAAFLSIVGFGIFSELMGWAITGKIYWTYSKGKSGWYSYWGVDGLFLLFFGMALTAIYLYVKKPGLKEVEIRNE